MRNGMTAVNMLVQEQARSSPSGSSFPSFFTVRWPPVTLQLGAEMPGLGSKSGLFFISTATDLEPPVPQRRQIETQELLQQVLYTKFKPR